MAKTAVVGIDIRYTDSKYRKFADKTFDEQLNNIEAAIRKICEELSQKEKESDWIISWREYGLTNKQDRYLTVEQKRKLKERMCELASAYPQLTIISGTVATHRKVATYQSKKRNSIRTAYKESAMYDSSQQFVRHYGKAMLPLDHNLPLTLIRNTAYIFKKKDVANNNDDLVDVFRHDKSMMWEETHGYDDAVFRPGKGQSQSPYINKHYGLEICREHGFGLLQKKIKTNKLPPPDMTMILSAQIDLVPGKIESNDAVHIDSHNGVTHYSKTGVSNNLNVYSFDILNANPKLEFVKPQSPIEFLCTQLNRQIDRVTEKTKIDVNIIDVINSRMGPLFKLNADSHAMLFKSIAEKSIELSKNISVGIPQKKFDYANKFLDGLFQLIDEDKVEDKVFEDLLMNAVELENADKIEFLLENFPAKIANKLTEPTLLKYIISIDRLDLLKEILSITDMQTDEHLNADGDTLENLAYEHVAWDIYGYILAEKEAKAKNISVSELSKHSGQTLFPIEFLCAHLEKQIDQVSEYANIKNIQELLKPKIGPHIELGVHHYAQLFKTITDKYISLDEHDHSNLQNIKFEYANSLLKDLSQIIDPAMIDNKIFEDLLMKSVRIRKGNAVEALLYLFIQKITNKLSDPQLLEYIISSQRKDLLVRILSTISIDVNAPIDASGQTLLMLADKYKATAIRDLLLSTIASEEESETESSEYSDSESSYETSDSSSVGSVSYSDSEEEVSDLEDSDVSQNDQNETKQNAGQDTVKFTLFKKETSDKEHLKAEPAKQQKKG